MIWIKPSGDEFETNDLPETIAYLESLGFTRKAAKSRTKAKPRNEGEAAD